LGESEDVVTGDAQDRRFTGQIKTLAVGNVGITRPNDVQDSDLQRFQSAVSGYYERLSAPSGLWGWKFPETYLIGPIIAKAFPHARYLHLVRDGRDVAFKRHLTDDPNRKLGRYLLASQNALELPHHLQAAISWAFQVDNFDKFRTSVPAGNVFDLTFEQLCLQPAEVVRGLCEFLAVPMTESCRACIENEIEPSKVGQHRTEDPRLVKEIEERIGPTLKRYGYLS